MKCGIETDITFELKNARTGKRADVDDFVIATYDVDQGNEGHGKETVTACRARALVTPDTELKMYKAVGKRCTTVESTSFGNYDDNPTDAHALTDRQARRSVDFVFGNRAKAVIKLKLGQCPSGGGRNVLFAPNPAVACYLARGSDALGWTGATNSSVLV